MKFLYKASIIKVFSCLVATAHDIVSKLLTFLYGLYIMQVPNRNSIATGPSAKSGETKVWMYGCELYLRLFGPSDTTPIVVLSRVI